MPAPPHEARALAFQRESIPSLRAHPANTKQSARVNSRRSQSIVWVELFRCFSEGRDPGRSNVPSVAMPHRASPTPRRATQRLSEQVPSRRFACAVSRTLLDRWASGNTLGTLPLTLLRPRDIYPSGLEAGLHRRAVFDCAGAFRNSTPCPTRPFMRSPMSLRFAQALAVYRGFAATCSSDSSIATSQLTTETCRVWTASGLLLSHDYRLNSGQ